MSLLAAARDNKIVVGEPGGPLDEVWVDGQGINDVALVPDGSGVVHSSWYSYYGPYPCFPSICYGVLVETATRYNPAGPYDDDTEVANGTGGWGVARLPDGSVLAAEYDGYESMICRYADPTVQDEPCDTVVQFTNDEVGWLSDPAVSPDGTLLAANVGAPGDDDGSTLRLFDVATGAPVRTLAALGHDPSFSPDGTTVVYGGNDGWLYLVPTGGGEPERLVEGTTPTWVAGNLP